MHSPNSACNHVAVGGFVVDVVEVDVVGEEENFETRGVLPPALFIPHNETKCHSRSAGSGFVPRSAL